MGLSFVTRNLDALNGEGKAFNHRQGAKQLDRKDMRLKKRRRLDTCRPQGQADNAVLDENLDLIQFLKVFHR
jgi:hypothetical protein